MSSPLVSVVLPVYNAEQFIKESLVSIRDQQGFNDFEVIVIDDGSTDNSYKVMDETCDERFLILRQEKNRGLITALNVGCRRATGKYIVRMDADDIMLPDRLIVQVGFMEQNPPIAVAGGYFDYIDADGRVTGSALEFPVQPADVREAFKTYTAVGHPTVIMRRDMLFELAPGLYPRKYPHAEDLGLWLEMLSKGAFFANVPRVVLHYRQHGGQVGAQYARVQRESTARAYDDWGAKIWQPVDELKSKSKLKLKKKN